LFLNGESIHAGIIDRTAANFISERKYNDIKKGRIARNDVLLTTRGNSVGDAAFVNIDEKGLINAQMLILRANNKNIHPRFLFYYLSSSTLRGYITNFASGSAQPQIPIRDLRKIPITLPAYDVQAKVAAILSTYDELIDNNKRRVELLEKMAEEIYREWFVRFRFPGHEGIHLVKGVPEGWSVKRFNEVVETYIGGGWGEDDQSATFSEGAYVIRGTDIPSVCVGQLEACPFRFHKPSNLASRTLFPGDFVFEVSGGSQDQLLGRNMMVSKAVLDFFAAPVMAASFCKQIRFRNDVVSSLFMKYFMKLYYDHGLVGIYQVQSTGISNYQFESFLKYQTIMIPPEKIQLDFEKYVGPLVELRDSLGIANIHLRRSRDRLLPRLISGRLSVENLSIQFPPGMKDEASASLPDDEEATEKEVRYA
jgi:type I restriction enzyme S subunit